MYYHLRTRGESIACSQLVCISVIGIQIFISTRNKEPSDPTGQANTPPVVSIPLAMHISKYPIMPVTLRTNKLTQHSQEGIDDHAQFTSKIKITRKTPLT